MAAQQLPAPAGLAPVFLARLLVLATVNPFGRTEWATGEVLSL